MPFYMWPSSHSDTVKTILNMVGTEKKVKGQELIIIMKTITGSLYCTCSFRKNLPHVPFSLLLLGLSYRRRLLMEHDLGLKLKHNRLATN